MKYAINVLKERLELLEEQQLPLAKKAYLENTNNEFVDWHKKNNDKIESNINELKEAINILKLSR